MITKRKLFAMIGLGILGASSANAGVEELTKKTVGFNAENIRKGKKNWNPNGQIQDRVRAIEQALGWRE